MIFKFRIFHAGVHVKAKMFVGDREGCLALSGSFVFRKSEWATFIGGLSAGLAPSDDKVIVYREDSPSE